MHAPAHFERSSLRVTTRPQDRSGYWQFLESGYAEENDRPDRLVGGWDRYGATPNLALHTSRAKLKFKTLQLFI